MNRPKEGEWWNHKAINHRIFITAVGIRNVLATEMRYDGIHEDIYDIYIIMDEYDRLNCTDCEGYKREKSSKS